MRRISDCGLGWRRLIMATALVVQFIGGSLPAAGQTAVSSENGFTLPVRGPVRVFVVFAEVEFDNACPDRAGTNAELPEWPRGGALPTYRDRLFDHEQPAAVPTGIVTDYYYQMSFGAYLVLGDYYPRVITMAARDGTNNCQPLPSAHDVLDRIAADHGPGGPFAGAPIVSARGHAMDDFDLWTPGGAYAAKRRIPDGRGDLALVLWRNYIEDKREECVGFCSSGSIGRSYSSPFGTLAGFGQTGQFTAGTTLRTALLPILFHEYSHPLFGNNNWHIGGGATNLGVPHTMMVVQGPFGMTAHSPSVSYVANGWDRHQLGWRGHGKSRLISALDAAGVQEAASDLRIDTHPKGATFTLRDFVTSGDAVRIKLPHLNWQPGLAKNQYLWLENHQSLRRRFDGSAIAAGDPADDRMFDVNAPGDANPCLLKWRPGLLVQMQIGKDMKDTDLDGDGQLTGPDIISEPNEQPSYMVQVTADGSHDFYYRFDHTAAADGNDCQWDNVGYPVERERSLPNPFTGMSDVFWYVDGGNGNVLATPRYVATGDGTIHQGDANSVLLDFVNGQVERRLRQAGDNGDTFSMAGGRTKIGLGTNPAPVPLYTFATTVGGAPLRPFLPQAAPSAYDNRTIWLNGVSIEIVDERARGDDGNDLVIRVRWDDRRIANDVRWTGNIVLQNDVRDPLLRQGRIVLAAGRNLYLDRGLSPTQHFANVAVEDIVFPADAPTIYPAGMSSEANVRLFTEPTTLLARAGSKVHLERGSTVWLLNGSALEIEAGAQLICEPGARVRGTVTAPPGAVRKAGDINGDMRVNSADLALLMSAVVARTKPIDPFLDLNEDDKVDIADARKLVTLYSALPSDPCQ